MKATKAWIAITLVAGLTLVGCGTSSNNASNNAGTNTPANGASSTQDPTAAIKSGVAQMITSSGNLKQAIDAGDDAKVQQVGPQLEDTWATFEDNVKAKFPDLYAEVEKNLDPTVAGSKATPLDKQALSQLNNALNDTLNKLQQKVQ